MKHSSSKNKAYAKALRGGGRQTTRTPYMDLVPAKRGKKYGGGSAALGTGAAGGAGGG